MAFSKLVRHFPSAIDTFVTVVGPLKKQKLCGLAKLQWRSVTPVAWSSHHRLRLLPSAYLPLTGGTAVRYPAPSMMEQVRQDRGRSPHRPGLQVGQPRAQGKDRTVASKLSSRLGARNPCNTEAAAAGTATSAVTSGASVASVASARHFPSALVGQVLLEYGMPAQQDSSGILTSLRTSQSRQSSPSAVPTPESRLPSNGCTCARRPLGVGGGSKRTTKPLPFHMMPYEVQAHLLQNRGVYQSGDAASWYPLRPPSLAAVAASATNTSSEDAGSPNRCEARRQASTSMYRACGVQGDADRRCFEEGKVLLATSLPEQALLLPNDLQQRVVRSESREGYGVTSEISTGRSSEAPEKSTDDSSVSTAATSLACSPASAEAVADAKEKAKARVNIDEAGGDVVLKALGLVARSCFVQATELHEVCLTLSNVCREELPWSLLIAEATPPQLVDHLWPGTTAAMLGHLPQTRLIPRSNITRLCVVDDRVVIFASWPGMVKRLELGGHFNHPVEGVLWPPGMQYLSFGPRFNQPVARVRWPAALKELIFGNDFNQPFSGVDLPAGLQRLDFGGRFNRCIAAVNWPESLEDLCLGHGFNRSIATVNWPRGLLKLVIDGEFPQRIEDVSWPPSLQHMALLGNFNQPVHGVKWPQGLRTLMLGNGFNRSLTSVHWPASLQTVVLGWEFDKKLSGVAWPPSLKKLTVPTEGLLGGERSNLPSGCVVESLYKSDGEKEGSGGAFVDRQQSDADQDEADECDFLSEDEDDDCDVDVFGYENEPWDMEDEAWEAVEAWKKLNLGQTASH